MGTWRPYASFSVPSARVSDTPAAHLLTVLKVAGATATASGAGKGRGSPGARQADLIGRPVCASTAGASKKPSPCGVAMTPTSQLRSAACGDQFADVPRDSGRAHDDVQEGPFGVFGHEGTLVNTRDRRWTPGVPSGPGGVPAFGIRARAEDAALVLLDAYVVDAGLAPGHQPVLVELPQLVAVRPIPLPVGVVRLVLEADGDAVAAEGPEVLAQGVLVFARPLGGEEFDDLGAAGDEGVAVAPDRVLGVGEGDLVGITGVPGVLGRLDLLDRGLAGEGREGGRRSWGCPFRYTRIRSTRIT